MNLQKPRRIADVKYRRWVKQHSCVVPEFFRTHFDSQLARCIWSEAEREDQVRCDGPIDPSHDVPPGQGRVGSKVSDRRCLPACRKHHQLIEENKIVMGDYAERKVREFNEAYQALNVKPSRTRKQGVSLREFRVSCDCWRKQHTIPKSKGFITGRCLVFTCPTTNERKSAVLA